LLSREQILVAKSRGLVETAPSGELIRLGVYQKVIRLRREIAGSVRKHAQFALAFDPQNQKWDDVLQDRREMIQKIRDRNNRINQIGGTFVPKKIAFTDDSD
jgi:hypothetical protein